MKLISTIATFVAITLLIVIMALSDYITADNVEIFYNNKVEFIPTGINIDSCQFEYGYAGVGNPG